MLYQEQNYLAPPAAPSVEGFKAWLERQPQGKTFNYGNGMSCAVAQYLTAIGHWSMGWYDKYRHIDVFAYKAMVNAYLRVERVTFGDVLREVRKVCP